MIHWWGRLVYSLASVAAAAVISVGSLILAGSSAPRQVGGVVAGTLSAGLVSAFIGLVFTFSLPGWLLGLPFVLTVKDLRAGRFWLWLAVGTCIGPLLIVALVAFEAARDPRLHFASSLHEALFFVCLATGVAGLTTLIYLLLLRWAQKREIKRIVVVESNARSQGF